MSTMTVPKTYKLFIGGAFPRSESGRSYAVRTRDGAFLANVAQASRKDARDAVRAARVAQGKWAAATAYNRGQVLYRVAEMLDGRAAQFAEEIAAVESVKPAQARAQVIAAVDSWIWHAGWTDKLAQVAGNANPVAGPFFNLSVPEPVGVVAAIAPQTGDSLLGLVRTIAPALTGGSSVVVVANESAPLPAATFAEVLATSDVPAGLVNILTGSPAEIAPWLASHADVNAIDLAGAGELDWPELQASAAQTLMRTHPPTAELGQSLSRILGFMETKTVWHTKSSR